jgi:hypothetical protein
MWYAFDMATKEKRFHEIGDDRGTRLFEECGDESGRIYRAEPARSGRSVPLGAELAQLTCEEDGAHWRVEVIASAGPAQVSTPAYRDGWDATFRGLN